MPNGVDGVEQSVGFKTSAGAVMVGLDRAVDEDLLPGTNFTYVSERLSYSPAFTKGLSGTSTSAMSR